MKSFLVIFVPALAVVAVGVTAAMRGEAADAPGLALIGIALITAALAAAVRTPPSAAASSRECGRRPRA